MDKKKYTIPRGTARISALLRPNGTCHRTSQEMTTKNNQKNRKQDVVPKIIVDGQPRSRAL